MSQDRTALHLTQTPQYDLLEWARTRCGVRYPVWPEGSEAIGVMQGDKIRAVMVLNACYGDACTVHFASDHTRTWATRNILGGLCGYAFLYRRMERLQLAIPVSNRRAMVAGIKLGFTPEGRTRGMGFYGEDIIIMSMLRTECSWLLAEDRAAGKEQDHG